MARLVLSECGIKPLPQSFAIPRKGFINNPTNITVLQSKDPIFSSRTAIPLGFSLYRGRDLVLRVSAPLKVPSVDEDDEVRERGVGGGRERISFDGEVAEEEAEFDPAAPPPFKLADIRAAIPKHCWVKDPWRSMSYVARDVAIVLGLAAGAAYLNNWLVWPLYWAAQGTMFWALFVLGHDW